MNKRSQNYLSAGARKEILGMHIPMDMHAVEARAESKGIPVRHAYIQSRRRLEVGFLCYAEERKLRLQKLADLEDQRGLRASLDRFRALADLRVHGFVNKTLAWWALKWDQIEEADRIAAADVGKVRIH